MRDILREFGSVVGLFVVVGLGLGLAGSLVVSRLTLGDLGGGAGSTVVGGLVFFQAVSVVYFTGPAVGAVGGVLAGLRSEDTAVGALAGGAGSLVGFYLMIAVAVLVMAVALSDGASGLSPGDNVTLIAASGVPAALVGGVTGAVAGVRAASAAAASRTAW